MTEFLILDSLNVNKIQFITKLSKSIDKVLFASSVQFELSWYISILPVSENFLGIKLIESLPYNMESLKRPKGGIDLDVNARLLVNLLKDAESANSGPVGSGYGLLKIMSSFKSLPVLSDELLFGCFFLCLIIDGISNPVFLFIISSHNDGLSLSIIISFMMGL